ncbi:MAG: AmmeMemoRadiSam system protein A [Spirochaetaceae bacterium]|jgi:AmmeMemoRadiSam system protein A|nr:AmmeMemoRadiSam system protein A [Spirochaetaceae bacterium]
MDLIITDEEKKTLLFYAREAISAQLEHRKPNYNTMNRPSRTIGEECECLRHPQALSRSSVLQQKCGAFVTLRGADNALRGCIGTMNAVYTLDEAVQTMALEAAFGDSRFPPLRREELHHCKIEISVLSPMELCTDPTTVIVGVHGLYLSHNGRTGVLLPQVPLEEGWSRQEYLDYICIKAGLPAQSYSAPGAKLFTFSAIVFGNI